MHLFLEILLNVTAPIIVLVALGWGCQPWLKVDVGSLNRLQVNVIMPCFLLHFLSTGNQPLSVVWPTAYFTIVQFLFLIPIGWLVALLFRMKPESGPVVGLGTAYANIGFFGIPVTQLAFGPEYLIYQSVMVALMATLSVVAGVWLLAPGGTGMGRKLKAAFLAPMIPAIILGLVLRGLEVRLPTVAAMPMQLIGSTFTPLALYTLGAQVASAPKGRITFGPQLMMLVLKFLLAPALTWALAAYMGFSPDLIALFVVSAATPVGVLITIYCMEYDRDPEFINSAVVISTAFSPLAVTGWIIAMRLQ